MISPAASAPLNLWQRMYAALATRLSVDLLADVLRKPVERQRFSLAELLGVAVALGVYLLALAFLGTGLWLLVAHWRNIIALLVALILLGLAYLARPRFAKQKGDIVPRAAIPTLYQLADQVATALGVAPAEGIIIDHRFNAEYAQVGWRQKRVVCLGLPLLTVLDSEEVVPLLAHELAHGLGADPAHWLLVNSARMALTEWYDVFRPQSLFGVIQSGDLVSVMVGLGKTFSNIILLLFSAIPWLGVFILSHLLYRDSQRAEYLADYWAAQIGGTGPARSILNKLRFGDALNQVVREAALSSAPRVSKDIFNNLRKSMPREAVPVASLADLADAEPLALEVTHPPLAFREKFICALSPALPKVTVSGYAREALERELAALKPDIQKKLIEQYIVSIS